MSFPVYYLASYITDHSCNKALYVHTSNMICALHGLFYYVTSYVCIYVNVKTLEYYFKMFLTIISFVCNLMTTYGKTQKRSMFCGCNYESATNKPPLLQIRVSIDYGT